MSIERPSRNQVWIAGYWDHQGDRWAWAPCRWEEPSQRDSRWIQQQFRREGSAYRHEPGRCSHQRVEEGEDYPRWRKEHEGRGRDHGRDDRHEHRNQKHGLFQ